ncbi:MAG: chemotaxis protein CheX [bacterium]
MNGDFSLEQWLDVALEATGEVATTALGGEFRVTHLEPPDPSIRTGAYIPLRSADQSLLVGLLGTESTCRKLARTLLGMEDEPEGDPSDPDVADAVGEIVNMLAGGIQRRMNGNDSRVELGLPIFVRGAILPTRRMEATMAGVVFDDVEAELLMFREPLTARGDHR